MIKKKIRIASLEELISQPRLVKYDTYEFDELSYTCLLMDIRALVFENKIYKEVVNKAIKYINGAYEMATYAKSVSLEEENIEDLLDILKEVEHE